MAADPRSNITEAKTDYVASDFDVDTKIKAAAAFNETNAKINEILAVFLAKNLIVRIPQ